MNWRYDLPVLILPPFVGAAVVQLLWLASGGPSRCFQDLDLSTPGIVCDSILTFAVGLTVLGLVHCVVNLPLAWWIRRRRPSFSGAQAAWIAGVVLAVIAIGLAPLTLRRIRVAGVGPGLWESVAEFLFPIAVGLAVTMWLVRRGTKGVRSVPAA